MKAKIKYPELVLRLNALIGYLMIPYTVFGKRAGVSNMHGILGGEIIPTVATLYKICRRYPVNIAWLMDGEGEMLKEDYFQKRYNQYTGTPQKGIEKVRAICDIYEITQREFCRQAKIRPGWTSDLAKKGVISEEMKGRIVQAFPAIPMDFFD